MTLLDRHKVFLSQNYLLYAIAFFIPLIPRLVPVFIVLLGASITEGNMIQFIKDDPCLSFLYILRTGGNNSEFRVLTGSIQRRRIK